MVIYLMNNNIYEYRFYSDKKSVLTPYSSRGRVVVDIDSYSLPLEYKNSLKKLFCFFLEKYKEKLKLYYPIGGCARQKITEGKSDIDLLVVLTTVTISDKKVISSFLNESSIKVGVSLYSEMEFINKNMDTRALCYCFCYGIGLYTSCFDSLAVFPKIKTEELQNLHIAVFLERVHLFKRYIFDNINSKYDIYLLIKKLKTLMAISLAKINIIAFDYEEVFALYAHLFNFKVFNFNDISYDYVVKFSFDFLVYLESFQEERTELLITKINYFLSS